MKYELRSVLVGVAAVAATLASVTAVADADLDQKMSNPENWASQAGDDANQRWSDLKQINAGNVGKLQVAWTMSTGVLRGHEGSPLVIGDTLYMHTPFPNNVYAVSLKDQTYKWKYEPKQDADVVPVMCCDTVNRGLAYGDGKIFLQQADTTLVALDAKTGKVVWTAKNGNPKIGETNTNAPHVFKDKVLTGISGGEFGVRGRVIAYDIKTGRKVWTGYSTGPDAEMLMDPAKTMTWTNGKMAPVGKDSSLKTWQGDQWKLGGGTTWGWYAYDPKLNLAFFGVGQTYDTGPLLHSINKPGVTQDSLYTDSTLALDPDTGKLAWHFQHVRNDQWDLDWAFEQEVMDLPVNGQTRKLIVTDGKMGIIEAMDAATGKYVFSKDQGIQNVISAIDPKTGEKSINPDVVVGDGKPHTICPHPGGGRNWNASSYNPQTKVLYTPMVESCMDLIPAGPGERGNLSSGYNWTIRPRPDTDGKYGRIEALNLETQQVVWKERHRAPDTTCILATAGGVVFSGSLDRFLRAYDDTTGKQLWQVRMNDVPSSCPISYSVKGRQYIAVVVGNGGIESQTFPTITPEIQNPQEHASSIWVFELPARLH